MESRSSNNLKGLIMKNRSYRYSYVQHSHLQRRILAVLGGAVALFAVGTAFAFVGILITHVPSANPATGTQGNVISPGYELRQVVQGSDALENPSGAIVQYGFLADGTKTEPDQNLYLVFPHNPGGPTAGYDYGRRFLFQGHENSGDLAYVTRINLDVKDPAHRITLLTPPGTDGLTHFNSIDGSTWDPFTKTLLFTQEAGSSGGVIQITASWPPVVNTLEGIIGKAGYEGIHLDDDGTIYLIEDSGGVTVNVVQGDTTSAKTAKQPNSFVYRFMPYDRADLSKGGKLQALQVSVNGTPLVFHAADPIGDVFADAQLKLHTPGSSWPTTWVTLHDTAVNGTASFDANAAAKAAGATPFKRPENMAFQPGSGFRTFYFCPTGDTDTTSGEQPALAARGAYGSVFRVDLSYNRNAGRISVFFLGDTIHNSFDNLTFADNVTLLAAEDRGDTLHDELNTLDSVWAFDVFRPEHAKRFIALGRDALAAPVGAEDNEPTGLFVSQGGTDVSNLLGTILNPLKAKAFVTEQHGENHTYSIVFDPDHDGDSDL
jgi:hypothetical protein